jgi:adenylosuccinate synthase
VATQGSFAMPSVIVVGAQWGDEGKGKIVDILTSKAKHIVRAQGGNNAGHTILIGSEEYKLHLIPSGVLHPHTQCYIGAGTVLDPKVLIQEIEFLESKGHTVKNRLWISPAAHVIFPYHQKLDTYLENKKETDSLGTTGRGIGPCYADKINRIGIRIGELVRPDLFPKILQNVLNLKNEDLSKIYPVNSRFYETLLNEYNDYGRQLKPYVTNFEQDLCQAIKNKEFVVLEGAQGTFLDITSGTYPFVTSSNTVAGGICVGAGIGPSHIDHTLGVMKAYTTRVGKGPLPSELTENENFLDHQEAREYGTTTGRKRRIGWFDAVLMKRAICLNGLQSLALTKLDILDNLETIKICVGYKLNQETLTEFPLLIEDFNLVEPMYESMPGWKKSTRGITNYKDLPENAKHYLKKIETLGDIPISIISLGPERESTIILKDVFFSKGNE